MLWKSSRLDFLGSRRDDNKEVRDSNIGLEFNSSDRFPFTSSKLLGKRCDTAFNYAVYDTL